tara:strand:- start:8379 stop:8711 length:333 start_codon:yes stop_codon:yes gene_type:complete
MNFNNEKLKYFVFSLLAVATLLLIYLEANAFGFKVQTLRQMWQACYMTSMRVEPQFPPQYHAMICDCTVDKGRKWYVTEHEYVKSSDNKTVMWSAFVNDCKYEIANTKAV